VRRSTIQRKRYANTSFALEAQVIEPVTYEEASQGSEWKKAMDEEIHALKENRTWDLVAKPAGVKPISCKWVYKEMTCSDGSIERYKA